MKRIFDVCFSILGLVLLLPLFIIITVLIIADSKGPVFYKQKRVGRNNVDFGLFKFRTMHVNADKLGMLTVGSHDRRITPIGYWLRKYKLDEIPQLINILIGQMSFVGPRPEVRKYVNLYSVQQQQVLSVRPGLTDWASIQYFNENDLLAASPDPERLYINEIIPAKILQNLRYINKQSFWVDMSIIFQTLKRVIHK